MQEPEQLACLLSAILKLLLQPHTNLQLMTRQLAELQRSRDTEDRSTDEAAPADPSTQRSS